MSGSIRAQRELDDLIRRMLFAHLDAARRATDPAAEARWLATATDILGPQEHWLSQLRQYLMGDRARLVVVLTWQCETRCTYCTIPKQDGREMDGPTLDSAIELLMSSGREKLELRFFGGEPMMAWEQIQYGIEAAQSACQGRDIQFMITTNGYALTPERVAFLLAEANEAVVASYVADPNSLVAEKVIKLSCAPSYVTVDCDDLQGVLQLLSAFGTDDCGPAAVVEAPEWCPDSPPQMCRMMCPETSCPAGQCKMRQGSCCTTSCQDFVPAGGGAGGAALVGG